ncbi:MAG TPA: tetraacyldisaccharide 4'-kinase [Candidatus Saccharimonadales bacterium]|nr:tetraacyldisaccharide 4'-kinase [Candidatus Saccharimonadales bacterium]
MSVPRPVQLLLWPLSLIYGGVSRIRVWLYARGWLKQKRLRGMVISVGNLTVGGTGKTPMVIWLAEKFLAEGKRVAILSRGYRGANGTSDEIELMRSRLRERVVFGVGADRYATGSALEAKGSIDVFLLDDGFQHLPLGRDLDILLMDASRPLNKELLLPAGRLREPIRAMSRANLLIVTRSEAVPGTTEAIGKLSQYPVFAAATRLLGFRLLGATGGVQTVDEIGSGPFLAFCGIGNPAAFFADLDAWGVKVSGTRAFADHHRYSDGDIAQIENAAERSGARALVTTEKDAENLAGVRRAKMPMYTAAIDFVISPAEDFDRLLDQAVLGHAGGAE